MGSPSGQKRCANFSSMITTCGLSAVSSSLKNRPLRSGISIVAGTGYFRTMEIPLRKGRFFNEDDTADKPQVVIIDEKFAQRFWPDGDPIGKHLWFDPKKPITIVGVVGVVKQYGLETEGKIATYFPHQQMPGQRMFLAVRTSS